METQSLPMLEVKGTPINRGRQHGESLKEKIHALVEEHFDSLARFSQNRAGILLTKEYQHDLCNRYLPFSKQYAPELVEEMEGIAEGADLPFQEIFFLNCFLDVYDIVFPGISHPLLYGCTTFAVVNSTTQDSGPIVAQNLDLRSFFKDYRAFFRVVPDEGPGSFIFSIAGVVGLAGFNNQGLALVFNKLVPVDSSFGVPYPLIARKVLQQSRMGQALYAIGHPRRASGSYFLLGSADAGIYGVETTAQTYQVFTPAQNSLAHSNHYIHPALLENNKYYFAYAGDSFIRLHQATSYFQACSPWVSIENIKDLARNHANHPDSICRHPDPESPQFSQAETIVSLVFLPRNNQGWISIGPPCSNEYIHYSLD